MNEIERELLKALIELTHASKMVQTANPRPNLQSLFNRIEELKSQLPPGIDPTLVHYLERKSYEKARLWLETKYPGVSHNG